MERKKLEITLTYWKIGYEKDYSLGVEDKVQKLSHISLKGAHGVGEE